MIFVGNSYHGDKTISSVIKIVIAHGYFIIDIAGFVYDAIIGDSI